MKKLERISGYYWIWIKIDNEWTIARYDEDGCWWFIGNDGSEKLGIDDIIGELIIRHKIREKIIDEYINSIDNGGYNFGDNILIRSLDEDSSKWVLTIKKLEVFNYELCEKSCTKSEIARYIRVFLAKKNNPIQALIKEIVPFT